MWTTGLLRTGHRSLIRRMQTGLEPCVIVSRCQNNSSSHSCQRATAGRTESPIILMENYLYVLFFFFFVSAFFKHRTNTLEKHKVNNMKVNRKKNERLRKATEKSMELPDEDTKMPLGKN